METVIPEPTVVCRAQASDNCMDGWPESEAYVGGVMREDQTWDGSSVICDECYLELGCPDSADV